MGINLAYFFLFLQINMWVLRSTCCALCRSNLTSIHNVFSKRNFISKEYFSEYPLISLYVLETENREDNKHSVDPDEGDFYHDHLNLLSLHRYLALKS